MPTGCFPRCALALAVTWKNPAPREPSYNRSSKNKRKGEACLASIAAGNHHLDCVRAHNLVVGKLLWVAALVPHLCNRSRATLSTRSPIRANADGRVVQTCHWLRGTVTTQ